LFALLYPREKLLLFGIIPLPAMFGALAFVGLDVWGVVAQAQGGGLPIGHGAHLGGALTGLLYYLFVLRPRLKR
jgi:membrane associated rhomboid family serine protease